MTEKTIPVTKNIRITISYTDTNEVLHRTEKKIDTEQLLQIVDEEDILKVKTSLPVTRVEGTKFTFDDKQVYYDNKSCNLHEAQGIIIVTLMKAYCEGSGPMKTEDLLNSLAESNNKIETGTFRRYLTEIRRTLRTATGVTEHNFIKSERNVGYRFDPLS